MYSDSPLMRRPNPPSKTNKNPKWSGWLNKSSIASKESTETNETGKEGEEKESDVTISETVVSNAAETSLVESNELLKDDLTEEQSMNLLKQFKYCEGLLKKIKNQLGIGAAINDKKK